MLVTQRHAITILAGANVGGRAAREALTAGLAGAPVRTSAALLYDSERVEALADRPVLDRNDLRREFPGGLFVARRAIQVDEPRESQVRAVAEGWRGFCELDWGLLMVEARFLGSIPLVASVGGFVAFGADLTGWRDGADDAVALELADPGDWYAALAGSRLLIPRGGRPWSIQWPGWGAWDNHSVDAA